MNGHIYKSKNSWGFMIDIGKDENGKRKQKRFSGFATKKDAERACMEKVIITNLDVPSNLQNLTLKSYLEMWLETFAKPNIALNTYSGYRTNICNHIIPHIGHIKLQKLQAKDIQNLYNKLHKTESNLEGTLSSQSVCYIHSTLRKALKDAYQMRYIICNPIDFVTPPKVEKYEAKFLNVTQINTLLKALENTDIYMPTLLAVGLGLRRGEALGLKYSDVNFEENTISINRTYIQIKGGYTMGDPKTKKSKRIIVASDKIINAIRKKHEFYVLEQKFFGTGFNKEGYICTNDRGDVLHCGVWDERFKDCLEKNDLPKIRIHDLRHSNASLMLKSGVPMKVASERLGHSKIGTTMDIYTHVDLEQQRDAAERIEKYLSID